jgi:serine phosphatase RsbU (regulator of sigma subunit)
MKKKHQHLHSVKMLLSICILAIGQFYSEAQTPRIDSLKLFLKTTQEDTIRVNALIELTRSYLFQLNDYNSLNQYTIEQLELSKKLGFKKGIAYSLLNKALYAKSKGDYKTALNLNFRALSLMQETRNKKGESSCFINIGQNYIDLGDYPKGIENTRKGIKIKEAINDLRGAATGYNNLGNIFLYQNKFDEARHYQLVSLKIKQQINDRLGVAMSYNNLGLIYYSQRRLDSALSYYKIALTIKEELLDKSALSTTYTNIGNIYFELKQIDEALVYQLKSLNASERGNDKRGILIAYHALGGVYEAKKNYPEAIRYYNMALDIAKDIDMKQGILESFRGLSSAYKGTGHFETSLHYLNLYYTEKDSLLNKENFKQLVELNTRYETDKKEKEILLLTKDQELNTKIIRQQQLERWGLIGGLGLLSISIVSIYRRYRFKKRANIILEKQKEEIQQKNILITDSIDYAQTIQEAVLPTQQEVHELLPESFILYKPKSIVSGDFYWLGLVGDHLICAVADCTGHGVPGAFMSLLGYNMLENAVKDAQETDPARILDTLHAEVKKRLTDGSEETKHGMDISLISINKTHQLQYAGAHNAVYIIRANELIELKADKIGIGENKKHVSFHSQQQELQKGDTVYLFTDGFPDQIGGAKRKKFYYPPFKELLLAISSLPMEEQKSKLQEAHLQWMGKMDQTDDILIMGIRIN